MKKITCIMFGCLISNSCTTVQIPGNGYHERYTITYEVNDPNGKPVILSKQDSCPKFIMPVMEPTPKTPYIDASCERDRKCVEEILLQHIESLMGVLNTNRTRLTEAKKKYESCEVK